MKIKRILVAFLAVVMFVSLFSFNTSAADVELYSYTYDYWGEAVVSPDGYEVEAIITGEDLGIGKFSDPQDIFIDDNGMIYIADTGNSRIVVLNSDWTVNKIFKDFTLNGNSSPLKNPYGIFVNSKNELIVADRDNRRVVRINQNSEILEEYVKPEGDSAKGGIVYAGVDFLPEKVVEDANGYVFVLCSQVYQGALMYSPDNVFLGYYGTNDTDVTAELLMNRFWRNFMTNKQREKTSLYFPFSFDNFYIDGDGFVYTCTELSETNEDQIKKLNSKGDNIMPKSILVSQTYRNRYGDLNSRVANGKKQQSMLTDITVDENGFITVVDSERGRIFQYDSSGTMIMAFGGISDRAGYFDKISSVENYNGKLYVLDRTKNDITVFKETPYGAKLHSAIIKYNNAEYKESEQEWLEVLSVNRNLQLAYSAIGKVYYDNGDYQEAMKYFKLGDDRDNYAKAFKFYRDNLIGDYLFPVLFAVIIIGVGTSYTVKFIKRKRH